MDKSDLGIFIVIYGLLPGSNCLRQLVLKEVEDAKCLAQYMLDSEQRLPAYITLIDKIKGKVEDKEC